MSARDRVAEHLSEKVGRFPDLPLDPVSTDDLSPRDAALATAIEHAVVRRWLTLKAVLEPRLRRPWTRMQHPVRAALLSGAAQLLLFDRLPEHAVINESVNWVNRRAGRTAGGFVNAVLRRISESRIERLESLTSADRDRREVIVRGDGAAWRLDQPVLDEDPVVRLGQQTSHASPLLTHWLNTEGRDVTARRAWHSMVNAPIIVTGVRAEAAADDDALIPHAQSGSFVFRGAHDTLLEALRRHSTMRVQDPTAAAPVTATIGRSYTHILDVCAGRGTKTRQLAQAHPHARITATDADPARRRTAAQACAALDNVTIVEPVSLRDAARDVDLLVFDVPCSNTGVLARRPEAKYRFTPESLRSLQSMQRQIMADHLALLTARGSVLYATCSLEPSENHEQAQWLAQWHGLAVVTERIHEPAGLPGDAQTDYRDGGYFALLER